MKTTIHAILSLTLSVVVVLAALLAPPCAAERHLHTGGKEKGGRAVTC